MFILLVARATKDGELLENYVGLQEINATLSKSFLLNEALSKANGILVPQGIPSR